MGPPDPHGPERHRRGDEEMVETRIAGHGQADLEMIRTGHIPGTI